MSVAVSPSASVRRGPSYLKFGAGWTALIGAVAIVLMWTSTEPALTFLALGVLIAGLKLLWRPGEPPILFAAFFIQWLQVSLALFRASFYNVDLIYLYEGEVGDGVVTATWLSLFGLLVLAVGIRLMLRGLGPTARSQMVLEIRQCSVARAFGVYCIAQLASFGLEAVTGLYPGLTQPLIAFTQLRWIFFFVLAVIAFVQRRGYLLLTFACIFEVVRGLLSFYSDYKTVFVVLAIALLTARPNLRIRTVAVSSLIVAAVIALSAAWSVIKEDYRDFLNAGTGQQVVLVGPMEQFERVSELLINEGIPRLSEGLDPLVRRIEYTFFFGRVVERVPSISPHTDGALWVGALIHVLTPRLLFPDKSSISADVENTQYYTGIRMIEQGGRDTEVPMGYMAESYIDFGSLGMFVPILLLGLLYGGQYRYIITRRQYVLLAAAAAPVLMLPMAKFEVSAIKILGGSLTTFGVFVVAFTFFAPRFYRLLQVPGAKRAPGGRATANNF
jgi:hypothetical protein